MTKISKTETKIKEPKTGKYFEGVGRWKTAVARVRVFNPVLEGVKKLETTINTKSLKDYFGSNKYRQIVESPLDKTAIKNVKVQIKVFGGGLHAQAEAIRLGISRALIISNPEWRSKLKALGYLKRDPRMVERKKFGSRKARRPQQWRKR